MNDLAYAIRAEGRAVEEGHHAISVGGGEYTVKSDTDDDVTYRLRPRLVEDGQSMRVRCSCPAGMARGALPIPCKHAALLARRLEREGSAVWRDGVGWVVAEGAGAKAWDDDPFADILAREGRS